MGLPFPARAWSVAAVAVFALSLAAPTAHFDRSQSPSSINPGAPILRYLRDYLSPPDKSARVYFARVERTDVRDEQILAYASGSQWCGTAGCHLLILAGSGSDYRVIGRLVVWPPIRVLETNTDGRADLGVWVAGGGIPKGYEALVNFNGEKYPFYGWPARPLPAKTPGKVLISRSAEGLPLW
jgi:hypothetical protein